MAIDNWENILALLTGWTLPKRDEIMGAKGGSGIPWLNVAIKGIDRTDLNIHNSWHPDGMGATMQFWAKAGSDVSKYQADVTFADLSMGKKFWERSEFALWHLVFNNYTSSGLADPVGGGPSTENGVDLHAFPKMARSFDAAGDFFAKHTETIKQWQEALGDDQAAWQGTAAGVFRNLLDDLHNKYENYTAELRPPGFQPTNASVSQGGYQSTTLHGDSLVGAEVALHKTLNDLYDTHFKFFWQSGKPIQTTTPSGASGSAVQPADPRDILNQVLQEITVWVNEHQVPYVHGVEHSAYAQGQTRSTSWETDGSYQESTHFGRLSDTSTWGAIANEAVSRWRTNIETNLDTPAIPIAKGLQTQWSRVLDPSWNTRFAFEDTSHSSLAGSLGLGAGANATDQAIKGAADAARKMTGGSESLGDGLSKISGDSNSFDGDMGGGDPGSAITTTGGSEALGGGHQSLFSGGFDSFSTGDDQTLTGGADTSGGSDSFSTGGGQSLIGGTDIPVIPPITPSSFLTGGGNPLGPDSGPTPPPTTTVTGDGSLLTGLPTGAQVLTPPGGGPSTVKNPDGSTTVQNPGGGLTTTHPDGSTTTVNPDGTVTTTGPQGDVTTTHIGAGQALTNPDGSHTTIGSDGSVTITAPDGSSITTHPDGSLTATNPDGSHSTTLPNGSVESVGSDGQVQLTGPDGSVTTNSADGSLTTKYPDGTSSTVSPDGTVSTTDASGHVTTTHIGTGEALTNPDGSTTDIGPDGDVTTHMPDGSSFSAHSDGSVTTTNADGSSSTQFPNGTVETVGTDGVTHLTTPDGSVATLNPDGSVTTGFADGGSTTVGPDGTITTTTGSGEHLASHLDPGQSLLNPDGSHTTIGDNGNITTTSADGSSFTIHPDGTVTTTTATGTSSLLGSGPGNPFISTVGAGGSLNGPDLSGLSNDIQNGLTTHNGDGSITSHFSGGATSLRGSDGFTTTRFPDGSSMTTGPNGEFQAMPSPDGATAAAAAAGGAGGGLGAGLGGAEGDPSSNVMGMMSPAMMMMGMARMGGQGQQGGGGGERVREVYDESDSDGAFLRGGQRTAQSAAGRAEDVYEEEEEDSEELLARPSQDQGHGGPRGARQATQSSSWSDSGDGVWGTEEGGLPASIGR